MSGTNRERKVPIDTTEEPEAHALNYWLSCLVVEVRRADGRSYPPRLYRIFLLASIDIARSICLAAQTSWIGRMNIFVI